MFRKALNKLLGAFVIVALLGSVALPAALAAPANQAEQTIADIATSEARFSTLAELLEQAGLVETLQGEGPFTLFAPTNTAFEELSPAQMTELQNNPEQLTHVLRYHLVDGRVSAGNAVRIEDVPTLQGSTLQVNLADDGETVTVNGWEFVETDVEAANGVIHVIDNLLLPAEQLDVLTPPQESIVETPADEVDIETAEMSDTLIFACVEDYVIQADDWLSRIAAHYYNDPLFYVAIHEATNLIAESDSSYLAIENADVIEVGQTVCIPSSRDAQIIVGGLTPSSEETPAAETTPGEETSVTGAEALTATTTLITEPAAEQTIVEILIEDDRFDSLMQAIQTANLVQRLEGEGPFTLFAPTDEAFQNLPEGRFGELLADETALRELLLHHLLDERATSADLILMEAAPVISGTAAAITYDADQSVLTIGEGTVTEPDIEAVNGLIHVVDTVLSPTAPNEATE